MAISDEEVRQVVNAITDALEPQESGPYAIADFLQQWHAEVAAGRPIDRKLRVAESPGLDEPADVPRARTRSTGEFVGKQDFSPTEELDLLLEALGLSFVAPPMMAARFLETVKQYRVNEETENPVTIHLAPTAEIGNPKLELDRIKIDQASQAVNQLSQVIREISREVENRDRLTGAEEQA